MIEPDSPECQRLYRRFLDGLVRKYDCKEARDALKWLRGVGV